MAKLVHFLTADESASIVRIAILMGLAERPGRWWRRIELDAARDCLVVWEGDRWTANSELAQLVEASLRTVAAPAQPS